MKKILSLLIAAMLFSIVVRADIRPPETEKPTPATKQKKSIDTQLFIELDRKEKYAKLIIPKDQIKQLRAELEQLDNEQNNQAALTDGFSRTQTIIGGLFMSSAFLLGGIWFARSRKINTKTGKSLAAGAALFCLGSLATIALGNAGPPPELRQITSKLFDKKVFGYWNSASGKIKLETATDNFPGIRLIVPNLPDEKKPAGEE